MLALLFFIQIAFSQNLDDFHFSLVEPPQNSPGHHVHIGDVVFLKPRINSDVIALSVQHRMQVQRNQTPSLPGQQYVIARVARTWKDDSLKSVEEKRRLLEMYGIRPLKEFEIEVEKLNQSGKETIYSIEDLAFTEGIKSQYFKINETVFFPETFQQLTSYKEGQIAGFFLNGDLIIKRNISYHRIEGHKVFKTDFSDSTLPQLTTNTFGIFNYRRPSSNITQQIPIKLKGINLDGEVLMFETRNSLFHILNTEEFTSKVEINLSCNQYFNP